MKHCLVDTHSIVNLGADGSPLKHHLSNPSNLDPNLCVSTYPIQVSSTKSIVTDVCTTPYHIGSYDMMFVGFRSPSGIELKHGNSGIFANLLAGFALSFGA